MNIQYNIKHRLSLALAWLMMLLALFSVQAQAASQTVFYHHDALGSIVAATNKNADILCNEEYQPYGEKIYQAGIGSCEHNEDWYTGKTYDDDLDLTYFGARWYDAKQGRFLSIDPVGVQPEKIHSFNRYAYANNNPYKYVDPDGEAAWFVPLVVSIIKEAAATGVEEATGIPVSTKGIGKKILRGEIKKNIAPKKGPDFIVSRNGTAVHASQQELKQSILGAGAKRQGPTTATSESGEIFRMNTGNGPMDIRIMQGKPNGGPLQGPRTIVTRPGTREYVHPNGARIEGAVSKSDRRGIGHIHGQRP